MLAFAPMKNLEKVMVEFDIACKEIRVKFEDVSIEEKT